MKIVRDDDGNVTHAMVHTPTKIVTAHIGDVIMKQKSGLHVIPGAAKKARNVKKVYRD